MENSVFQRGTTLQPFSMVVGPILASIHSSYVVINRHTILLKSPLCAVEVTFKIFACFKLQLFQSQCMWVALFNIHEESTNQIMTLPNVVSLIETLKV